eukprot:2121592-Rhodomonas_salina.2
MGLSKAGKDCLHIEEVNSRLVMQLKTEQKAFTTVKDLSTTAITIAQKHIEQMPKEVITPAAALAIKMGATKSVLKVGSKLALMEEADDDTTTA